MDKSEDFLKKLATVKEIPTLPQIALKLLAIISDKNSSMKNMGKLIEGDPPLVAKILRMVNNGHYNLRNEVKNIQQAIVMIGIGELRNLVFSMSVFNVFYHMKDSNHFSFLKFWKHSAATGKVAAVLGKYIGLTSSHTAFLAGVLHDFGRLILLLYFQEEYNNVFLYSATHQVCLQKAEEATTGFTHSDAGYWLAQKWKLPEEISLIIRDHHNPLVDNKVHDELLALVYVADRITNICGIGVQMLPLMDDLEDDLIWQNLKKKYSKLDQFPLEKMTEVFDMHLEEAESLVDQIFKQRESTKDR